jgi:hypothetical protein
MSLPIAANTRTWIATALCACATLFAGCTTSPTTGRAQFNILPGALETTVPDLRFDVKTMLASAGDYCRDEATPEAPCAARESAEKLSRRIAPIAERLGAVTPTLAPELVTRVPHVEVFIVPNDAPSVTSSAGGKIAVASGLARLNLSDTDLALALAREFGRLAAAHHRESTSAGLAVSLITSSPLVGAYAATSLLADLLFPMGALFKVGISLIGSIGTEQLVEASQQGEADEFAGKLLQAAGFDLRELAEARPDAPDSAVKLGWLPGYFTSRAKVAGVAPPPVMMTRATGDPELPLEAKAEIAAPPNEMAGKAVANPEPPTEVKVEAAVPAPVVTATVVNDQKPAAEAKDETAAPSSEMTAKLVASPEPPSGDKMAVATPAPEMGAAAVNAQKPAPESKEGTVAPPPESTAITVARQEPPLQDKAVLAAPAPAETTVIAATSQAPAAMAGPEADKPLLPSARTPELQKKPSAAKKGASKPPVKNRKKIRKPPKKPVRP